ncbi:MAG: type IV pilus twitching motility protein PilT [Sphingobacterium sp.]|nr:type IV pilus twitching motility protein PilT [Sphingobacterium sp.]
MTKEQIHHFEKDAENRFELDFAYGVQVLGRFRVNVHRTAGDDRVRPPGPGRPDPRLERPRACRRRSRSFTDGQAGPGPRHRTDGQRQVDDPGRDHRLDQLDRDNDHIITDRRPDRVPPRAQEVLRHPARSRAGRRHPVASRTPCSAALRQDPDVILVGEMRDLRDDRNRHHLGRNGPSGLRHPPHLQAPPRPSTGSSTFSPADQQPQVRMQLATQPPGSRLPDPLAPDRQARPDPGLRIDVRQLRHPE